jgi:hypothetical protein
VVVAREEHVVGFDVAVDDAARVDGGERVGDRQKHLHGALGDDPTPSAQTPTERLPLELIHDEVRAGRKRDAVIEHTHDRRVTHSRRGARLAHQPIGEVRTVGAREVRVAVQQLDRDGQVQHQVLRQPDRPHRAFAERL